MRLPVLALLCVLAVRFSSQSALAQSGATFSPDGHTLATLGKDCSICLWDVQTGTLKATLRGHKDRLGALAFSPDGETLTSWSAYGETILWDTQTGQLKQWLRNEKIPDFQPFPVVYSPDGKMVAVGTLGLKETPGQGKRFIPGVRIWDAHSGTLRQTLDTGEYASVNAIAFWPDGKSVSLGVWLGGQVWSLTKGKRIWFLPGGSYGTPLAFSKDGKQAVTVGTLSQAEPSLLPEEKPALSGGGLGSSPIHNIPEIWDMAARRLKWRLKGHDATMSVERAVFSPDGKTLLTSASRLEIRGDTGFSRVEWKVWDTQTGRLRWEFAKDEDASEVSFSPDSKRLFSRGNIRDVQSGKILLTVEKSMPGLFSPDGKTLANGYGNPTLWSAETGKILWQHPR